MTASRQHAAAFLLALALFAFPLLPAIDGGAAITILSGVHAGCQGLFVRDDVRGIADLKGKRAGGDPQRLWLIAAYVGLDPKKDLTLVDVIGAEGVDLFAEGVYGVSPRRSGITRAQGRPCDIEDRRGPTLVAVFLLHDGGEPGVCRTISGGDKACDPRRPESGRSVRPRA